jgi:hypothetical protein
MHAIDNKRTCKAKLVRVFEDDGGAPNGIDAEPGDCQRREPYRGEIDPRLMFACPGCGQWGSIPVGHPKPAKSPSWDIVAGSLDDPTTLSLTPSILCQSCCGWHGYLTSGEFRSC